MNTQVEMVQTLIPLCACPLCGARAIVLLTAEQLAVQPDTTTHVCHPALGGCNHGFEDVDTEPNRMANREARRKALFETAPVCMICTKPIRSLTTAVLWTSPDAPDALVHGSNGSDCYLKAVRGSVDRYRATPRKAVS